MPFYLATFIVVVVGLLAWGLKERGRIVEFPFLAGVAFAGFVLPQLVGLSRNAAMLPPGALDRLLLMGTLCAAMCWIGYASGSKKWPGFGWSFDGKQLQVAASGLLLVGLVFWGLVFNLPEEELSSGGFAGTVVAYLFLARLTSYAFAISLLLYLYRRDRSSLILLAVAALPTLYRIVLLGRRASAAELVIGTVAAVWLVREKLPPRAIFAPFVVVAMLMASFSAGDYRSRALDDDGFSFGEIGTIEWWANVQNVMNEGGSELPNALYTMAIAAEDGVFDYGTSAWDTFIFSYVPAQIVGVEFKESLYLGWGMDVATRDQTMAGRFGYRRVGGSTTTGITDSFLSFGYLGCFKFFVIGWIMAHLYGAARRGDFVSQLVYTLLAVPAMHAVTHNTAWFFKDWPHMLVFIVPALMWARVRVRQPREWMNGLPRASYP